ncbi:MAG: glycosyltransferase [Bacteroidota bacterium]|nr:glycosyltransferase [Bacteroidota bacterium]
MIIYFIVTNDLTYDQRMIRICNSLAHEGYTVKLIGRNQRDSIPLRHEPFQQKRLNCFFTKGKLFYAEYNSRLFFYLLLKKTDCICAIDLDTILPCYFISRIKGVKRVYDAHELFCEMKEIATRRSIYKIWKSIEKFTVPKFKRGYTVNHFIADEFKKMYDADYEVIRNVPVKKEILIPEKTEKYILYQGAVNEGRCFETLIPAMKFVNAGLIICGDGNFIKQAKQLVADNDLKDKIIFKGSVSPYELQKYTLNAWIGINLIDDKGLNNYYSLANRFFDYMHAGVPQLCSDFPAYREINKQHEIAVLIVDLTSENIAREINILLEDEILYKRLQHNCLQAKVIYNWQNEEKKLLSFYKTVLG